jgi:hypothetical protein
VTLTEDAPRRVAYVDARGAKVGLGIVFEGAFVGMAGQRCNALYPADAVIPSPRAWAASSSMADRWEMFRCLASSDMPGSCVRNPVMQVRPVSLTAVRGMRDLAAALGAPGAGCFN